MVGCGAANDPRNTPPLRGQKVLQDFSEAPKSPYMEEQATVSDVHVEVDDTSACETATSGSNEMGTTEMPDAKPTSNADVSVLWSRITSGKDRIEENGVKRDENIVEPIGSHKVEETDSHQLSLFAPADVAALDIERGPYVAQSAYLPDVDPENADSNAEPMTEDERKKEENKQKKKLGWFLGVYIPVFSNVIGIILFLRLTWIVGQAGLILTVVIEAIASAVVYLTALSMSAVATNGVVLSGGSYFMISRTLGFAAGGAVGLMFFCGTSVAASMYVLGAVETSIFLTGFTYKYVYVVLSSFFTFLPAVDSFPDIFWSFDNQVQGTIVLFTCLICVFFGAKLVSKIGTVFLVIVVLSLISIYVGIITSNFNIPPRQLEGTGITGFSLETLWSNLWPADLSVGNLLAIFAECVVLLAIYFPAVTGIMAGSNRSGDLRDAQSSIPLGTLSAMVTCSVIYLSVAFLFACTVEKSALQSNKLIVVSISYPLPIFVVGGILAATLGAALESLLGAPRILMAMSKDKLVPGMYPFTICIGGEPRIALAFTYAIAQSGVMIGNLDLVAPIITMFFLTCYGFVNLSCFVQEMVKSPNWRPSFKFYHWTTALVGTILCILIMFVIEWAAALASFAITLGIYKYIDYRQTGKDWGDALYGLRLQQARDVLLQTDVNRTHTKNFRPQVLAFVETTAGGQVAETDSMILSFVSQLKKGRGLCMVASIVEGDVEPSGQTYQDLEQRKQVLRSGMEAHDVEGFPQVFMSPTLGVGMDFVFQNAGLGGLSPNTVIFRWPTKWKEGNGTDVFLVNNIQRAVSTSRAIVLLMSKETWPGIDTSGKYFEDLYAEEQAEKEEARRRKKEKKRMEREREKKLRQREAVEDVANNTVTWNDETVMSEIASPLPMSPPVAIPAPAALSVMEGTIDVWWIVHDGGLLLLIPFLMMKHRVWKKCRLRVFTVSVASDEDPKELEIQLQKKLHRLRIPAEVHAVQMGSEMLDLYMEDMEQRRLERQARYDEAELTVDKTMKTMQGFMYGVVTAKDRTLSLQANPRPSHLSEDDEAVTSDDKSRDVDHEASSFDVEMDQSEVMDETALEDTLPEPDEELHTVFVSPRENARKKPSSAHRLNHLMHKFSAEADLVIVNLPNQGHRSPRVYLSYVEVMTKGFKRCLLVRGSGREVVTMYS